MKLTGKFKSRYEELQKRLAEIIDEPLPDEKGFIMLQLDILNNLEKDVPHILREVVLSDEALAILNPDTVNIAKFNTPDKVTDVNGVAYTRIRVKEIKFPIIFKKTGEDKYYIILQKEEPEAPINLENASEE